MAAAAKGVGGDAGAASLGSKMAKMSVGVKLEDHPLTEEEITAIKAVHAGLKEKLADGEEIGIKAVVACTLIYKLRVERAIESYMDWKTCREEFGIKSMFGEGWEDAGPELTKHWSRAYSVVGRDSAGRQVFWINGAAIEKEDEGKVIEAACIFFLGMYGDLHTLRNGNTMVIDQSKSSKKTGNERKMQKSWQQFPNRPQKIFITGPVLYTPSRPSRRRVDFPSHRRPTRPPTQHSHAPSRCGGVTRGCCFQAGKVCARLLVC